MIVKSFVRVDSRHSDSRWPLRETDHEQGARPAGGMSIAGPQLAMPEVLAPTLEVE